MATTSRIQDFDDPTYNPFLSHEDNFGADADPYPRIHELRAQAAVVPGSFRQLMGYPCYYPDVPKFSVVGSKEVEEALIDPARFSNSGYEVTLGHTFGMGSISVMDNPVHGRWRRIFQKIFLPQHVKTWGETIVDPVVHGLMSSFLPRGEADLVAEFTHSYPFEVIYKQLNLPRSDVGTFQRLAIGQTDFEHMPQAIEAGIKLGEYFRALVEERRANPGDDLISMLATTEDDGVHLPELVLISFLRQLMNAAGDTTYRGTSILLSALLRNPDQLEAVGKDRSLIPAAIEEALRWDGPVLSQTRVAVRDTELGGVKIPAGSYLDVLAGAANRDPAIYPDPDRFDIFRERHAHYSFARGPHICVGQHLARVEMTRALHAVMDNLRNLRLDPDKPAPAIRGYMMRVPEHIYVKFDRVTVDG
ncbi:cytochrome P450 [Novosphingobium taihuense]|uniref:Cytochrome P450 n=1 Tax=Novosphingobium taihuense TaxID=260085 RepID=A0A7W7EWG3_9SPHN|nr:cytochrome P450 [Novosphingobium taihuense]MBB4614255.1 cytochrome P450 [Novosphingobium taihuense]TWH87102.1 cytochrome P450 [Novosphingobium taihuense]